MAASFQLAEFLETVAVRAGSISDGFRESVANASGSDKKNAFAL
jgi:hypothetical protein